MKKQKSDVDFHDFGLFLLVLELWSVWQDSGCIQVLYHPILVFFSSSDVDF